MNTENTTPTADSGRLPDAARYAAGHEAACPHCTDGAVDSGGVTPWGWPIWIKCGHCDGAGRIPNDGTPPHNARSAADRDNNQPHETDANSTK